RRPVEARAISRSPGDRQKMPPHTKDNRESRLLEMPDGTLTPPSSPQRGGRGRRGGIYAPKGRGVEPEALEDVRRLLGTRERRADLLIEHLHLIQDHYGHLSARHMAA